MSQNSIPAIDRARTILVALIEDIRNNNNLPRPHIKDLVEAHDLIERAVQTIRESARIKVEAEPLCRPPRLPLSKREGEVLQWVIIGKTDRDIGQILSISPKTVNVHVENIKRKYKVTNRVMLAHDVARVSAGSVF